MLVPLALVFDTDPSIREAVSGLLRESGFEPFEAASPQQALELLRARSVAVAVLGVASSRDASYDLVGRSLRLRPTAVVAVMDAEAPVRWTEAAWAGAFDVLERPPEGPRLAAFARRATAQHRLLEELRRLRALSESDGPIAIVGRSEGIEALRRRVGRLAETSSPVLFVGEPGTGRAHAARALAARGGSDVEVVVAGAPGAERRLLGDPGAAPSAGVLGRDLPVHVVAIEALPFPAQERLAVVLASERGGARVTASTTLDPEVAAADGRLHPELVAAFRSGIVPIPPLRDRREDVAVLTRAFLEGLRRLNSLPPIGVEPEALERLEAFSWPGNVRELRDAVETAVILVADGTLRARDLPGVLAGSPHKPQPGVRSDRRFREAKRRVVDAFERAYLVDLLEQKRGNVTGAAGRAGMLRSALQRLLRKHDLHSASFRDGTGAGGGHGSA